MTEKQKYTVTPCFICDNPIEYLYWPTKENPECLLRAFDVTFKCEDGSGHAGSLFKGYICVDCFESKIKNVTYLANIIMPSLGPENLPECLSILLPDELKVENAMMEDETVFLPDLGVFVPKTMKNKIEAVMEQNPDIDLAKLSELLVEE